LWPPCYAERLSAETSDVRNVTLRLSPLLVFDKHGNDDRVGAASPSTTA
jgi:hypothetical protein